MTKHASQPIIKLMQHFFSRSICLIGLMFFVTTSFVSLTLRASPHPGVGSSIITDPDHGYFFSKMGFGLNRGNTPWILDSDLASSVDLKFHPADSNSEGLSVKIDDIQVDLTAEAYSKRWLRDYDHFGFEVLGSQSFQQNLDPAYVIDFLHRKKQQQFRQVIFVKNKKVVLFTCKSSLENFKKNLGPCNSIIRTFKWMPESLVKTQ